MTTPLENLFPNGANLPSGADMVVYLASTIIAVFDDPDLSAEDFSIQPYPAIAIRGDDGDLTLYAYDATDTTTADDGGVTCIVVSGRRYIRTTELIVQDSALSATTTAQPVSPALGDTYVVPAAPSGDDWASKAKTVATYTARGWKFRNPWPGMIVYVEDEATYYHYTAAGSWAAGLPLGAIADGTITPMKLAHPFAILKVVDERNAPPGSAPTAGTMYQVGTAPTGAFAANTKEIARYNGTSYDFIAPGEGDTIYRLDEAVLYTYRSGLWGVTNDPPAILRAKRADVADEVLSSVSGTTPVYSTGISIASLTSRKLRVTVFNVQAKLNTTSVTQFVVELYRDTESTPLASFISNLTDTTYGVAFAATASWQFMLDVPDTSSHDYRIGVKASEATSARTPTLTYDLMIEEVELS